MSQRDAYGFFSTATKVEEQVNRQERMREIHERVVAGTPSSVTAVLDERGKRYGKFLPHAEVTQRLKMSIASELQKRGKMLALDQQEALDMICHKIGRIVNGDADYDDSWVDIAGYAQLVADRLRGVPR